MKKLGRDFWLMMLLTLAGTALRIADLTGRSMWLDEGFTLTRLHGDWLQILTNVVIVQGKSTVDLHPPLYFILLKAWGMLLGNSEYALKLVSAFAAILLIPATYVLSRRLFGRRIAIAAVLLALLSPTYQYYGHELRMYALVPLLAALSSYVIYRAAQFKRLKFRHWAIYIVLTLLSLLTHYALLGVCIAQLLFMFAVIIVRRGRYNLRSAIILVLEVFFIAVCAALVIFFVGNTVTMGGILDVNSRIRQLIEGQIYWQNARQLLTIATDFINSALFGMNASDPSRGVLTMLVLGICLLGLLFPNRYVQLNAESRIFLRARFFIGIMVFAPIVLLFLAAVAVDRWTTFRYIIGSVPALHILLAYVCVLVIDALRRWWNRIIQPVGNILFAIFGLIGIALALAAQVHGMVSTFARSPEWQDDWRSVAQYIRDNWRPGDVIVLDAIYSPEDVLATYFRELPITIKSVSDLVDITTGKHASVSQYTRVWYANTGGQPIGSTTKVGKLLLSMHAHEPVDFAGQTNILQMILYEAQSPLMQRAPDTARLIETDVTGVRYPYIAAYALGPANPYHRYPNLRLTLYWQRPSNGVPLTTNSLAVRLKTADNRTWADWFMPAQLNSAPKEWIHDNLYRVDYVALIPMGLPRQPYLLELALGAGEKAEIVGTVILSLNLSDVDCCVRLARWPLSGLVRHDTVVWRANDVTLNRTEYPSTVMPGDVLPVVLTWKLDRPVNVEWQTQLSLEGLFGGSVTESLSSTGTDEMPLAKWPMGESVRSMHALVVPFATRPGLYRLNMSRVFSDGHQADSTLLGWVEVKEFPSTPVVATMQHQVSGKAGEMSLLGYALDQPFTRTVTLRFQLSWRVESPPSRDGVLFLHVIGPAGNLVAQDDNPPEQGKRSTLTYRAGEGIQQMHRLVIPSDAPGGEYRLYAGVYNRGGITRWSAQQNGVAAPDDLLFLGALTLPELPKYRYKIYVPMVSQSQ